MAPEAWRDAWMRYCDGDLEDEGGDRVAGHAFAAEELDELIDGGVSMEELWRDIGGEG